MSEAHLARHQLEQLVAGDARGRVHPALRVHLAACDQCSMRKRALEAAQANFLAARPERDFARGVIERVSQPAPAPRARWYSSRVLRVLLALAGLLALAAGAFFWIARAPQSQTPAATDTRAGVSLHVLVSRDGKNSVVKDGATLAPGDQLVFEYALDRPQHLLLLGIDDAGAITRYFPGDPTRAAPRPATAYARLPVVLELDARKGDERLYAFFYAANLDEEDARGAMIQALSAARARGGIAAMHELDLPAQQVTLWFRK